MAHYFFCLIEEKMRKIWAFEVLFFSQLNRSIHCPYMIRISAFPVHGTETGPEKKMAKIISRKAPNGWAKK
jgi:hypothetical protein